MSVVARTTLSARTGPRTLVAMRVVVLLLTATGCDFQLGQLADARPIDAPVGAHDTREFNNANCPSAYERELASSNSRYRVILAPAIYREQHADCADDSTGWTHLATIDDAQELTSLITILPASYTYVGGVQLRDQAMVTAGWRWLDGRPISLSWAASPRAQPEDGDAIEDNAENITLLAAGGLHDETGIRAYSAICECDGVSVDPALAAVIP